LKVEISGQSSSGGGYSTVEDEAIPVTQRTTMNFTGGGVSVADSGGKTVVTITGSASGATGTTTVNFGAFPGSSDTSVAVTGQASIVAGSIVSAWIRPVATADHTADEHWVETIEIAAGNISAGTGFTIYAKNTNQINEPVTYPPGANSLWQLAATTINNKNAQPGQIGFGGGQGTRLYGQFTVQWKGE
jgi:hypothetical protein